MAQAKKQNYLHGAAILGAGVIIMKILGAIYKIPLMNLLGDTGYGYFNVAYNIYNIFLTISSAGLPVALSRMISEANTLNRPAQVRRIFRVALAGFFVLGLACSLVMFLLPTELAISMNSPKASQCILALSPAVVLVCLTSAYRGFVQGHGNMVPTTIGQVLEVLFKVLVGVTLALVFVRGGKSLPISAAGAVFGTTAGSLVALLYMMAVTRKQYRRELSAAGATDKPDSSRRILIQLLRIGIPITLGLSISSIVTLLDSKLVLFQMKETLQYSEAMADELYGVYSGVQTLFNLPAAFVTPLTVSVVPAVSAAVVQRNYKEAGMVARSALRVTALLAMPMGVGLAVLAKPIVSVIYPHANVAGGTLLCYLGIASVFVCITLITNALLQANGNEKLPMLYMLVGGAVKVVVNFILVGNPKINIYGAPIGTICCYAVICVLNLRALWVHMPHAPSASRCLVRPAICTVVMGAVAWGVYGLCHRVTGAHFGTWMGTASAMLVAIVVAILVYFVLVIATRSITMEDMRLLPKGERLAKKLHIR